MARELSAKRSKSRRRSLSPTERARRMTIVEDLRQCYPGTAQELCELNFSTPFQLAVATILSAQCTDVTVNSVTPALFGQFPGVDELAHADQGEVEQLIYRTGFYRSKAKHIIAMAQQVTNEFDGTLPTALEDLVQLSGIGRKTANVIRSVAYGEPGLAVDTHVIRLSNVLGLTTSRDPEKIEREFYEWLPPEDTGTMSLRLILHGRRVCSARKRRCSECLLAQLCPSVVM